MKLQKPIAVPHKLIIKSPFGCVSVAEQRRKLTLNAVSINHPETPKKKGGVEQKTGGKLIYNLN